ncbi:MAG TPA: hypothetical protein ENI92_05030, partial [Bacteroidetes bacterium]|nr:hypothetical protein [Bacteroidota bacterium]
MQQLERIVIFVLENKEHFATLLVTLLTIVKLTSWGRAKAKALDAVIGVIERLGAKEVKGAVAAREAGLPAAATAPLTSLAPRRSMTPMTASRAFALARPHEVS